MKENLCRSCQKNQSGCIFKLYGNLIKETSIPNIPTIEDIGKLSNLMERHRKRAMIKNCPNINSFQLFEVSLFIKRYLGQISQNHHVVITPPENSMSKLTARIKSELELKIEQQNKISNS